MAWGGAEGAVPDAERDGGDGGAADADHHGRRQRRTAPADRGEHLRQDGADAVFRGADRVFGGYVGALGSVRGGGAAAGEFCGDGGGDPRRADHGDGDGRHGGGAGGAVSAQFERCCGHGVGGLERCGCQGRGGAVRPGQWVSERAGRGVHGVPGGGVHSSDGGGLDRRAVRVQRGHRPGGKAGFHLVQRQRDDPAPGGLL